MSTTTPRQGLILPATADAALIGDLNTNASTIDAETAWLNKANTVTSAFTLDESAAPDTTGHRLPNKANAAPLTAGVIAFDSTNKAIVFGDGSATQRLLTPSVTNPGLTGATAASRYVGATASGAPASGTFAVGDFVIDQTGTIWICTVAGSPGTWASPNGSWATWTPIVEQGGSTPTLAANTNTRYEKSGKTVVAAASMTMSSAGSAGNDIICSIPVNAAFSLTYLPIGQFIYVRSGIICYTGNVEVDSSQPGFVRFMVNGNASPVYIGSAPSFAVANNDVLGFTVTYQAA